MTDIGRGLHTDSPGRDVVVVGSGAAALAGAIAAHDNGARVTVVERTSSLGGTTAVSGGGIWMPQNLHMATLGIDDSREEALAYMGRLTAGAHRWNCSSATWTRARASSPGWRSPRLSGSGR